MALVLFTVFYLGACIGSFLNVCIYRIPEGQSVVQPRSHCPSCGALITWWQNIPIISYLLLGGACARCKSSISIRYPLVEGLTGALLFCVFYRFGIGYWTIAYFMFVAALVTVSFIDLDHQIIPNVISLPGIVLGFLASFLIPWLSPMDSLLGIFAGGGSLWFVAWSYARLKGIEGMGGGDVKLLAMIGAFMGWKAILPVVFLSSLAGTIVGVPLMLRHRGEGQFKLPFGPFLSAAAVIWLLWGHALWAWYLSLFLT